MTEEPLLISRAIVEWTGKGKTMYPQPDMARLLEAFGPIEATRLLPIVQRLQNEFFSSDAKDTIAGLQEMGDAAAEQFRQRHPEMTDEAIKALTNLYTWTYK